MRARFLTRLGAEAADALDEFLAQVMAAEGRGVRDLESLAQALAALDITVKREMDRGAGEVRVALTAIGEGGFSLRVEDDGCGIADGTTKGTGLGTKLIQAMVQALRASLHYEPAERGVRAVLVAQA